MPRAYPFTVAWVVKGGARIVYRPQGAVTLAAALKWAKAATHSGLLAWVEQTGQRAERAS